MRHHKFLLRALALPASMLAVPALAAPGDSFESNGTAVAEVADPATIKRVSDLRFGRFASPGNPSTIRINVDGTFNATGEVASSTGMAQPAEGRGPAQFTVEQAGNRGGTVFLPGTIVITNGTANMTVPLALEGEEPETPEADEARKAEGEIDDLFVELIEE